MSDDLHPSAATPSAEHKRTTDTLKARARLLSRRLDVDRTRGLEIEVIEFRLAHERYAVEGIFVREICPLQNLTPLPFVPPFYRGIVNIRGQVLPVLDIKRFFELPETGITDLHVVIVVQADGIELGLLADAVIGARSIARGSLQSSLPTLTGIRSTYLKGIADDSLVILDAARVLNDPKIIVDQGAEAQS